MKNPVKLIFFFLLPFFFSCISLSGQCTYEYWFAAPRVNPDHGNTPVRLHFTNIGNAPANSVSVHLFGNGFTYNNVPTIPVGQSVSLDLSSNLAFVENDPGINLSAKLGNGILVTSDVRLSAYYEEGSANNPEIFNLKGANALGKEFYIPSQNAFSNFWTVGEVYESVIIVATEDNTEIRIFPPSCGQSSCPNTSFYTVLDKGETFVFRCNNSSNPFANMAGFHIKVITGGPIAVTISDDSLQDHCVPCYAVDLIGDQIIPVDQLGDEYLVVRGDMNFKDRICIVAAYPFTHVDFRVSPWYNSIPSINLDAGCFKMIELKNSLSNPDNAVFIKSNAPIYVYHITGTDSGSGTEMGSALIPPLSCTGSNKVGYFRTANSGTKIYAMLTKKTSTNSSAFTLNGNATSWANKFTAMPYPYTQWEYAKIDVSQDMLPNHSYIIENNTGNFHLGILNQVGASVEYAYFSEFGQLDLCMNEEWCPGENVVLDAGSGFDNYAWYVYGSGIPFAQTQTITVNQPGHFELRVVCDGETLKTDNIYVTQTEKCANYCCDSTNLLRNGNFISGQIAPFNSSYSPEPVVANNSVNPGEFKVITGTEAKQISGQWDVLDHTTCNDSGHFMVVNGRTQQTGSSVIWSFNVSLKPKTSYKFCANLKNLPQCEFDILPVVQFVVPTVYNGIQTTINAGNGACDWQLLEEVFTPTNATSTTLEIHLDEQGIGDGNDLAIDDIYFQEIPLFPAQQIAFQIASYPIQNLPNKVEIEATPDIPISGLPTGCEDGYFIAALENNSSISNLVFDFSVWMGTYGWGSYINNWSYITKFPGFNNGNNVNQAGQFDKSRMYIIARVISNCDCFGGNYVAAFYKPATSKRRASSKPEIVSGVKLPQAKLDEMLEIIRKHKIQDMDQKSKN